ncbi:LysR family transcriptional regulator [Diaphorobacter aerolatus]|uniref:LysR family transcriptional regulator n=1 Tax=Diaphorobacter aerolatus TaxID=1288495 RepID=A0A7H0GKB3_9BURK|nr:LysR family transcriptional regulator [Diaphorobacter aerolatus]QNP48729.1 LysR family transcriptional regulator [Diaphorobacter aerolatus]
MPSTRSGSQSPSLDALAAFAKVAQHRSFSAAARELGVTASALSHGLTQLEATLQLRLLHRTTRSVTPTEAGQVLLERLSPAIGDMHLALQEARSMGAAPTGKLRLNVPRQAARIVLAPVLAAFHEQCPEVELEIATDDRLVDIVQGGFDAGIRFGERLADGMIALPLQPVPRFIVVGTPAYFARSGKPELPEDLKSHACINRSFSGGATYHWEFSKQGRRLEVQVNGPLRLDDDVMIVQAALAGVGLAYVYEDMVSKALADGRLECALADWCPPTEGFYLYYPSRRHLPPALRALMALLQARTAKTSD